MVEALKNRPENITPEHFMSSPTEAFSPWFNTLSLCLEDEINRSARDIAHDPSINLQIGSELEFHLFSKDFCPHLHDKYSRTDNPNYSEEHFSQLAHLKEKMLTPRFEGGLGDILCESEGETVTLLKNFMEIRTAPGSVEDFLEYMGELKSWMQKETEQRDINPVVYSQHIHFSLRGKTNLLQDTNGEADFMKKAMLNVYQRTLPLIRLPEEIESNGPIVYSRANIRTNGRPSDPNGPNPIRIEARINNSEYAFDPSLNLLIHLIGMQQGLFYSTQELGWDEIGSDFPLHNPYLLKIYGSHINIEQALDRLPEDKIMQEYLPQEVLYGIKDIVKCYREVSEGRMSVAVLKKIADARAYEIDPDMYSIGKDKALKGSLLFLDSQHESPAAAD
jgi:hypothetical protein